MPNRTIVITDPSKLKAVGMLQLYFMLKMEVDNPSGPIWRAKPARRARKVLTDAGRPNPGRYKKQVLAAYTAYLIEQKILTDKF